MINLNKQQLLQHIADISVMARGKLSAYSFKGRSADCGPYYKLQHWQNGKNITRYISPEELPAVKEGLAGYAKYNQLTEQYAQLVINETRQNIAASKKKTSHPKSSLPKKRKSNN